MLFLSLLSCLSYISICHSHLWSPKRLSGSVAQWQRKSETKNTEAMEGRALRVTAHMDKWGGGRDRGRETFQPQNVAFYNF